MRRCIMCEEPDPMYLPADDIDDVGLYSCGSCGFEMEGPRMTVAALIVPAPTPTPLPVYAAADDVVDLLELAPLEAVLL